MRFLDTNVILRYLTKDDEGKAAACFALFQRIKAGEEEVTTTEVVLHEVLFVLCSRAHYALSHEEAVARLRPVLVLGGFKLAHKRCYLRALDIYAAFSFLDFGDALTVAYMEDRSVQELYSYDTDFDRIEAVRRIEPGA